MTQLSDLNKYVLPHVQGCSDVLVELVIQRAVIEFYEQSTLRHQAITPISSVATQALYTLPNPAGFQIVHARNARYDDKPLAPISEDQLDNEWSELSQGYTFRLYHHHAFAGLDQESWREAESTQPRWWYHQTPNDIRLVGIPTTTIANAIDADIVLKPLPTVTQIDDWIFNTYYEDLAHGALSMLFRMPKKKWSDKGLAEYHDGMFVEGWQDAHGDALRSFLRKDQGTGRAQSWA